MFLFQGLGEAQAEDELDKSECRNDDVCVKSAIKESLEVLRNAAFIADEIDKHCKDCNAGDENARDQVPRSAEFLSASGDECDKEVDASKSEERGRQNERDTARYACCKRFFQSGKLRDDKHP